MAITSVTIENFKGIREPVRIKLKPITLRLSPNSADKSTNTSWRPRHDP